MMRSLTAEREPTTTNFSFYERESFVYAETERLSQTVISSREQAKE